MHQTSWEKSVAICFGRSGSDRYGFYFNHTHTASIDIELEAFNKEYLPLLKYEFGNLWSVTTVVVFLSYREIVMHDSFKKKMQLFWFPIVFSYTIILYPNVVFATQVIA